MAICFRVHAIRRSNLDCAYFSMQDDLFQSAVGNQSVWRSILECMQSGDLIQIALILVCRTIYFRAHHSLIQSVCNQIVWGTIVKVHMNLDRALYFSTLKDLLFSAFKGDLIQIALILVCRTIYFSAPQSNTGDLLQYTLIAGNLFQIIRHPITEAI